MPKSPRTRFLLAALSLIAVYAVIRVASATHSLRKQSAIATIGTLTVEYVIDPTDARWRAKPFGRDFDITSAPTVIVRNGDGLYEIDAPFGRGVFSSVKVTGHVPESIAIDNDDTPLIVTEGYLGTLEDSGENIDAVPLPYKDMRLAHSVMNGVVYLYGGKQSDYRLYSFADNGQFRIVAQIDEPIVSVVDSQSALYFATPTSLFRIFDGKLTRLFKLSDNDLGGPVVSVAVTPDNAVIFFSTAAQVYALRGAGALSIVNNSGGELRVRGDRLYVLDESRGLLYTLHPATRMLFGEGPA